MHRGRSVTPADPSPQLIPRRWIGARAFPSGWAVRVRRDLSGPCAREREGDARRFRVLACRDPHPSTQVRTKMVAKTFTVECTMIRFRHFRLSVEAFQLTDPSIGVELTHAGPSNDLVIVLYELPSHTEY